MNLSKKAPEDGLDNVLSESPIIDPKEIFEEYLLIKDEGFAIKFEGSFREGRRIDKQSPKRINEIAEGFLRELCARSGIYYKNLHAYWRFCWNEFHHPHLHLTILLRGLHKSKPQLIKMAKTARRVWRRQNAADGQGEIFIKEKGTRQRVHSYAMRKNEGIFNYFDKTPRLNRLLIKRSDDWPKVEQMEKPQQSPITGGQNPSSESRVGHNSFTNPVARSAPILEVNRPFFAKSPPRIGHKKGKIRAFWDKMAHFLGKIAPKSKKRFYIL